jgi:hypothetical protein
VAKASISVSRSILPSLWRYTLILTVKMRCQFGQDGGKRATYPGYSVGSFMAAKHTGATGLGALSPGLPVQLGGKRAGPR